MTTSRNWGQFDGYRGTGLRAGLTGVLLLGGEETGDLVTDLTVGHANVILGLAVIAHQRQETVVRDVKLRARQHKGGSSQEAEKPTSWYSLRVTLGTSMLWVEGLRSSSFLPVKMSMATR